MHWISFDDKSNGYRIYNRNKILVERNIQFVKYNSKIEKKKIK